MTGLTDGRGLRQPAFVEHAPQVALLELELGAVLDVLIAAAAARPEMPAARRGPPRRRRLDPDRLGHPGRPALPDDLDEEGLSRDRSGDEELAAAGLGLSVARREVDVLDLDRERRGREPGQQAADLLHREADDVVVVALHPGDEGVADLLDGVGPGLVEERALVEVALDHLVRELAEGDVGQVVAGEQAVLVPAIKGQAGDDPVPPAGQGPEHVPGVLPAGRLAQDAQPQGDDGVGADDDRLREALGGGPGLEDGRGDREVEGVLGGDGGFVDVGREDAELRRDPGHELPAPGRGRGEDDVHAAYCTRIRGARQPGPYLGKSFAPHSASTA